MFWDLKRSCERTCMCLRNHGPISMLSLRSFAPDWFSKFALGRTGYNSNLQFRSLDRFIYNVVCLTWYIVLKRIWAQNFLKTKRSSSCHEYYSCIKSKEQFRNPTPQPHHLYPNKSTLPTITSNASESKNSKKYSRPFSYSRLMPYCRSVMLLRTPGVKARSTFLSY